MLSYLHGFHAGNFADVHKHALLTLVLGALARKQTPFAYLETHAGRGLYPLDGAQAQKTGEYRDGIGRLWDHADPPAALAPYLEAVRRCNAGTLAAYPGSPRLARGMLRPADRAVLMELHPAESAALVAEFRRDRQVSVHRRDAFEGLPALLPPRERRGLVLVDPSYENKRDYTAVAELIGRAHRRWPNGVYVIWYPLLVEGRHARLLARLRETGIPKQLDTRIEVALPRAGRMFGSGMVVVNPPWPVVQAWDGLNRWLAGILAQGAAVADTRWLVPEAPATGRSGAGTPGGADTLPG